MATFINKILQRGRSSIGLSKPLLNFQTTLTWDKFHNELTISYQLPSSSSSEPNEYLAISLCSSAERNYLLKMPVSTRKGTWTISRNELRVEDDQELLEVRYYSSASVILGTSPSFRLPHKCTISVVKEEVETFETFDNLSVHVQWEFFNPEEPDLHAHDRLLLLKAGSKFDLSRMEEFEGWFACASGKSRGQVKLSVSGLVRNRTEQFELVYVHNIDTVWGRSLPVCFPNLPVQSSEEVQELALQGSKKANAASALQHLEVFQPKVRDLTPNPLLTIVPELSQFEQMIQHREQVKKGVRCVRLLLQL